VFHIWQFCKWYSFSCSEPQCLLNLQRDKTNCVSAACVLNCNCVSAACVLNCNCVSAACVLNCNSSNGD
jgi:hypothetical protein